jgi:hypothetical protein
MRKKPDESFKKQLDAIRPLLPSTYTTILEYKNYKFKKQHVYNVIHCGVENWEILEALKSIVDEIKVNN